MSFLSKLFGDANERTIKQLQDKVLQINELEPKFQSLSLDELRGQRDIFRERLEKGETLDDILPEAFAAVREAARRTLGQRHFDVQLIGGMVLHQGKIAEMRTGEGKTLVATLPTYLNAIEGKGVHVVTVNDYLSRRDAVWMGQIHYALGLSVACINHEASYLYDPSHIPPAEDAKELDTERDTIGSFHVVHEFLKPVSRREAYEADVTYGTNNEYGFDYLRDNMAYTLEQMTQARGPSSAGLLAGEAGATAGRHHYAIVDEIDSILIDEARTPLIISAPDTDSGELYQTFSRIAPKLTAETDYVVDEKLKTVSITEAGIEKVEKLLGVSNIYEEGGVNYVHHLEQALRANVLFKKDTDYVTRDGEIVIVDEFTGRLMPGRRWSNGLHQAVEAKEKVSVQKESKTLATITFQNYFRLYEKLSGMTGTAQTSAEEFHKVYNLDVVSAPTNKPNIRQDLPDRIYKTEAGKLRAIAREVKERSEKGQPVLIGTVSIQKNEILSTMLDREGVEHNLLNAKNHEKEGELVAQAGRRGAVTVATNIAGRGVDIILGGNPSSPEEAATVRELGGLHVIGTERHEARRIDNQLRGRAGRQGDPGSSQFFVSTEDEVVRIFGGDRLRNIMETLGVGEDDVIEHGLVSRAIEQAQSKIEGHNFDSRKYVLEYDDVMNKHRETIYALRRSALIGDSIEDTVLDYVHSELNAIIDHAFSQNLEHQEGEDLQNIETVMPLDDENKKELQELFKSGDQEATRSRLLAVADEIYDAHESEITAEVMRQLEKTLLLRVIDELWVDHLEQMEYLRDSVRLRAYGQRDPLIEYKIEGQKLFNQLQAEIARQVAHAIFKVSMMPSKQQPRTVRMMQDSGNQPASAGRPRETSAREVTPTDDHGNKVGRNDPCPCGSGKKYKKCHGK